MLTIFPFVLLEGGGDEVGRGKEAAKQEQASAVQKGRGKKKRIIFSRLTGERLREERKDLLSIFYSDLDRRRGWNFYLSSYYFVLHGMGKGERETQSL